MNIHCSACGTPLPSGAKFCPACALPLTAIAIPTLPPVRRPRPIWPYFLGAFLIFWVIAYASDQATMKREAELHAADMAKPARVLSPAEIAADAKVDERVERGIDREIWNSPDQIRDRITLLSSLPWHNDVNQRAIARLQKRLKELHSQ